MKCEIVNREQLIDDFLLDKLAAKEAEAFERHMFGCRECLDELRLREQIIKLIKEERITALKEVAPLRHTQPPAGFFGAFAGLFRARPHAWIYAGVAAALLLAILVSPIFRDKHAAENYAANFTPSPRLESLIRQALRSLDVVVVVASPGNEESFSAGDVLFRWQIKKNGKEIDAPVELKILSNQETLIHSESIAGKEYRWRDRLTPGLYYWTIEYEGEMLYLGKFFQR